MRYMVHVAEIVFCVCVLNAWHISIDVVGIIHGKQS